MIGGRPLQLPNSRLLKEITTITERTPALLAKVPDQGGRDFAFPYSDARGFRLRYLMSITSFPCSL